ncbi:MAG: hypothetical protein NTU62_15420, partial [Spirochaetes bacterium]|nr:hypothetical protein [Spirochaetota bacterium]
VVTVLVFVIGSLFGSGREGNGAIVARVPRGTGRWAALFAAFFVLGCDFWAWGRRPVLVLGLPLWVLYYGALGLLLALAIAACARWAVSDRAQTSSHLKLSKG